MLDTLRRMQEVYREFKWRRKGMGFEMARSGYSMVDYVENAQ
jgi:hypothetical protein